MMDNCRIYVCKSIFGSKDQCKKFNNMEEYWKWVNLEPPELYNSTFQPICNCKDIFDRMILTIRSNKIGIVDIKD